VSVGINFTLPYKNLKYLSILLAGSDLPVATRRSDTTKNNAVSIANYSTDCVRYISLSYIEVVPKF